MRFDGVAAATAVSLYALLAISPQRACAQDGCEASVRQLQPPVILPFAGAQGIALDADGSLWICSTLSNTIHHFSPDLERIGSFEAPFAALGRNEVSGIAYNSDSDTLFLCQPVLKEIFEVEKDGTVVQSFILDLDAPPNIIAEPFPKGLAFDPTGDGGAGSLWVVEAIMTQIYEISLSGARLRTFCHPDDEDECPGFGRAAYSNDIGVIAIDGETVGLELVGGEDRRDQLRHVDFDGVPSGLSYPLGEAGGRPGGFARARIRHPDTGEFVDVFYVTVESSAELHVLEILPHRILPIQELECESVGVDQDVRVALTWINSQTYDSIDVFREGEFIATLPGDATSFEDATPTPGESWYTIGSRFEGCATFESCITVQGAGQILNFVRFNEAPPFRRPQDIAEDAEGLLWIVDSEGELQAYTKDLQFATSVEGPFPEGDLSGIAFNPDENTLFVYDQDTNEVVEMNTVGEVVDGPFPSGVPSDPDDKAEVVAMLYNPEAEGGEGAFLYLDLTTGLLQERRRDGTLIRSCTHPDAIAEPAPPGAIFETVAFGMSYIPGLGFDVVEVGGGRVRDGRVTRFLRLDLVSCEALGFEVPVSDLVDEENVAAFAYHRSIHDGRPVAFVAGYAFDVSNLFEIDVVPPALPHPTNVSCSQPGEARDVELRFKVHGDAETVEVLRGQDRIAMLPGDTELYVDRDVPEGAQVYHVRSHRDGLRSDERSCRLRVGIGSIAEREFAYPGALLHQVSYDPLADNYLAATVLTTKARMVLRYSPALEFLDETDTPFRAPQQIAALTVRGREDRPGDESQVFCLGWNPGAQPGQQDEFTVHKIRPSGALLDTFTVRLPRPERGAVTFPTGLAWDAGTDTLWCLAKNSRTVQHFSLTGEHLGGFEHPANPHQDDVDNFGIAFDPLRNTLLLSSAGRFDYDVTKLVEVSRGGQVTGVEIPIGADGFYRRIRGFTLCPDGRSVLVSASRGTVNDLVRHRSHSSVTPVTELTCTANRFDVELTWTIGEAYDSIRIERNTVTMDVLDGDATTWLDVAPPPRSHTYRVVGIVGSEDTGAVCQAAPEREFLRADVEVNGVINITDGVTILSFLFLGAAAPSCLDAADVDDSGDVEVTDALRVFNFLFLAGPPPAPPHPEPGLDPTEDALDCGAN